MGRPIYPHELEDPDFAWLISNFKENNPTCSPVENTCLPVVFIKEDKTLLDTQALPPPPAKMVKPGALPGKP